MSFKSSKTAKKSRRQKSGEQLAKAREAARAKLLHSIEIFKHSPDDARVRPNVVAALRARSPADLWRAIKDGRFPPPQKLGAKHSSWACGVVRGALAQESAA